MRKDRGIGTPGQEVWRTDVWRAPWCLRPGRLVEVSASREKGQPVVEEGGWMALVQRRSWRGVRARKGDIVMGVYCQVPGWDVRCTLCYTITDIAGEGVN